MSINPISAFNAELIERCRPREPHALPKVRQLYLSLYSAIESGRLPFDTHLPSSRELSRQLGVARNTVISVYEQLTAEGLLSADGRRGTRVSRLISQSTKQSEPAWCLSDRSASIRTTQSEHRVLAPGEPDTTLFPQALWRKANSSAARLAAADLGYRVHALSATRASIARYLATYRSLVVDPAQIIITSGTRQSLVLAATLYSDPGDEAWVECPGYLGAVDAFNQLGLNVKPCRVDSQGLVPPNSFSAAPRLIYLTPCFQYPLGMSLGVERRDALLALSRKTGCVLFEDDYDSEFRDDSQPRPALASDGATARVLHAGTFSKLLFPAVRVGWLVVPMQCVEAANRCLKSIGGGNNTIAQAAVTELLDNGAIARHLRHARQVYGQRRRALVEALANCELLEPIDQVPGSLSLLLRFKYSVSLETLQLELNKNQIGAVPLEKFQWNKRNPTRCSGLVVGLGNIETLVIPRTTNRLIRVLRLVDTKKLPVN